MSIFISVDVDLDMKVAINANGFGVLTLEIFPMSSWLCVRVPLRLNSIIHCS